MIQVTLTKKDGSKEYGEFRGWIEFAEWVEHRHGQYVEVDAHEVGADKIRQGRKWV